MLRTRQSLGKYRIDRRIGKGGFADVYRAYDTIEGVRVALKIPQKQFMTKEALEDFRKEVRLTAQLDHPNILPIKNASFIDGHFVIVHPLGERSLDDRLTSRVSLKTALGYFEQMLEALAYAHRRRIVHCDVKPENFIIFPGDRLRLTDFGIAKIALRTVRASGSGTIGYIAPEQAMGKPSPRSDVFSVGLVFYRMVSGQLPEWPFDWPPGGFAVVRRKLHPDLIALLRRAVQVDPRKRFADADQMLGAFRRVKSRAQAYSARRRRRGNNSGRRDWKAIRRQQFVREYGKSLATRFQCERCGGPVSEAMHVCPWCGANRRVHRNGTQFPAHCPRCNRGVKLDWRFCPWCYGPGFEPADSRQYSDVRYEARCANPHCSRKLLMPFMRYCPWCHRKVRRKWNVADSKEKCASCGWGVLRAFWDYCPWCGKTLARR